MYKVLGIFPNWVNKSGSKFFPFAIPLHFRKKCTNTVNKTGSFLGTERHIKKRTEALM